MKKVSWAPVVFHSFFGRWDTMAPLEFATFFQFCTDLVLLWQAMAYPTVSQDVEEDE